MASNDVQMENAHKPDPGNDIKESEDKVLDSEIVLKGNDIPSAVTVTGNADNSENGGDNLNSNEVKDQVTAMSGLENQTNRENETNEPMSVEPVEPTGEQIDTESKDKEEISTEANAEAQTDSGSIVQTLTDTKTDTESKNEEEIRTKANAEVQTDAGSIVHRLTNAKTEMVENRDANNGLKEEDPVQNGVESENRVENVEGDSSGDVAVEKTKDSEEDEDCAKNVAKIVMANENADSGFDSRENRKLETRVSSNEAPQVQSVTLDKVSQSGDKEMEDAANANEDKIVNDEPKQHVKETVFASPVTDGNTKSVETLTKLEVNDSSLPNQHEAATPNSLVRYLPPNIGSNSGEADKTVYSHATLPLVMNKSQKDSMTELIFSPYPLE